MRKVIVILLVVLSTVCLAVSPQAAAVEEKSDKAMPAVIHLRGVTGPMTVSRDLFFAAPIGGNRECDAIYLEATNGITVRDCWFGGWRRAVHIRGVSDHWLRNLVFELNQEGINVL